MIVEENVPSEDIEILCQCFSAEIIEYNLKTNNSRPHYVKYIVKEIKKEISHDKRLP